MTIKTILIDDEKYSLDQIEYLLSNEITFEVAGSFTDPLKALERIETIGPKVIFLDINMPSINGLELGSKILDRWPELMIVYMTAYDQFAIQAFEIAAIDYILKPVSPQRFKKTLERVHKRFSYLEILKESEALKEAKSKLVVRTLGDFQVRWEHCEPVKWRTEKTKELFAFLLHNANKEISREVLLNTIFDKGDLNLSTHNLHNNIYYIKKALKDYGIPCSQIDITGKYKLNINEDLIDVKQLKYGLNLVSKSKDLERMAAVEKLYTGDYYEGMDWLWADLERESILNKYMNLIIHLSEKYIKLNKYNDAEEILLKAFQRDAYLEDVTHSLITLYLETKRSDLALKHYRKYEKLLCEDLGISPSAEIRNLINKINRSYKQVV